MELIQVIGLIAVAASGLASAAGAQASGTLAVPPDSPRWEMEGSAKAAEFQGRKASSSMAARRP